MSTISTTSIQFHECSKCNNVHEYIIDSLFLLRLKAPLRVRCAVCGEIRQRVQGPELINVKPE